MSSHRAVKIHDGTIVSPPMPGRSARVRTSLLLGLIVCTCMGAAASTFLSPPPAGPSPVAVGAARPEKASPKPQSTPEKTTTINRAVPSVIPSAVSSAPAARQRSARSLTLLDEVGRLYRPLLHSVTDGWKRDSGSSRTAGSRRAELHVWLGEWELACNEQPEKALSHFEQARKCSSAAEPIYGLAAYDTAISLFYEGAYRQSADTFQWLLTKSHLRGFDPRNCALWLRHAGACAGIHEANARLGITEPARLDPYCGVSSLAACLHALGQPWDRASLLKNMRVTGEGSSLEDILNAGKKLDVHARAVTADDGGLMRMPLPCVAYVEHDHFIAIVEVKQDHVSYLCSDCGAYPGGLRRLSWKQFHALNPGLYIAVTKPGSYQDGWPRC